MISFMKRYPHQFKEGEPQYVFHGGKPKKSTSKLCVRSIEYIIEKLVDKAKVNERITPHSFRRSFATNLYEQGVGLIGIRDSMGHASLKTTEIYIKSHGKYREAIPTGLDAAESVINRK